MIWLAWSELVQDRRGQESALVLADLADFEIQADYLGEVDRRESAVRDSVVTG